MGEESQRWTFGAVKEGKLIWLAAVASRAAAASMAAGEPISITNALVTVASGCCSRSPRRSHDPRTLGMQLAKFTTVGSVRGSSRMD